MMAMSKQEKVGKSVYESVLEERRARKFKQSRMVWFRITNSAIPYYLNVDAAFYYYLRKQ